MHLSSPETEQEFQQYYHLRWRILRKPWGQAEGSEQDDNENNAYHVMAMENNKTVAVARLEFFNDTAQLRYMAVDDAYQKQGIGRSIILHMEKYAKENNTHTLFLNAREIAVGFYEKQGYKVTEKSYLLFGSIQHFKMMKKL